MKPKPVQNIAQPAYPTRREVLAGAASFALVNLAGSSFVFAEAESDAIAVAPIFEHGDGRGATGCVVVSPPVFLSEEEAMQIIHEELVKHGVQLKDGVVLESVRIPQRMRTYDFEEIGKKASEKTVVESKKHAKPFALSGIDSEKNIAVEFVSKQHYFDLGGVQESYSSNELDDTDARAETDSRGARAALHYSSAQTYDFRTTAEFVAAQVKNQGKGPIHLGLFYDPLRQARRTTREKDDLLELREALEMRGKSRDQKKDASKQLLRLQVQDFVAWLKEQQVIE
jgi:hypothetical protein